VNIKRAVVLTSQADSFEAGQPIELSLQATEAKLPLVIAAYCRGTQVAQQTLTTRRGDNSLSLTLPEEVGGVLRVTVYDYSQQTPEPIAERLVYRQSNRQLNVHVAGHSEGYSPGERVALTLRVT